jgi:hypothetical protein
MTTLPTTPRPSAPRWTACRRKVGPSRILAVFEPRSNTMKLGTMKAQLPWSLEQADLAFCHSGGLGWDAVEAMAPMGERARVADTIDERAGSGGGRGPAGRPCAVHEQWRLWRHPRQAAEGP